MSNNQDQENNSNKKFGADSNLTTRCSRVFISEFICTFVLVFSGSMAKILVGDIGKLGVSLVHGMSLFVAQVIGSEVSGGHANPVISFAYYLCGKSSLEGALLRITSQYASSIFTAVFMMMFFDHTISDLGAPRVGPYTTHGLAIVYEVTYSSLLVLVSLRAPKEFKPLACAFVLSIANINGSDISNGALNPARAFGSSLVTGRVSDLPVYMVAPMIGSIIGSLLQILMHIEIPHKREILDTELVFKTHTETQYHDYT